MAARVARHAEGVGAAGVAHARVQAGVVGALAVARARAVPVHHALGRVLADPSRGVLDLGKYPNMVMVQHAITQ